MRARGIEGRNQRPDTRRNSTAMLLPKSKNRLQPRGRPYTGHCCAMPCRSVDQHLTALAQRGIVGGPVRGAVAGWRRLRHDALLTCWIPAVNPHRLRLCNNARRRRSFSAACQESRTATPATRASGAERLSPRPSCRQRGNATTAICLPSWAAREQKARELHGFDYLYTHARAYLVSSA